MNLSSKRFEIIKPHWSGHNLRYRLVLLFMSECQKVTDKCYHDDPHPQRQHCTLYEVFSLRPCRGKLHYLGLNEGLSTVLFLKTGRLFFE